MITAEAIQRKFLMINIVLTELFSFFVKIRFLPHQVFLDFSFEPVLITTIQIGHKMYEESVDILLR